MISKRAKVVNFIFKYAFKPLQTPGLIPMRLVYWFLHLLAILWPIPRSVRIDPVAEPGVHGEWVSVCEHSNPNQVIYYLHGGGYFFGSPRTHRNLTWRLARETGIDLFSLRYRMAPHYPVHASVGDAIAGYRWLLSKGYQADNIVMGGDSAGGSLTLLTLQKIRSLGLPMPKAAFCLSPMTDMSVDGKSMEENAKHDPVFHPRVIRKLTAFHSRYHRDPKHPEISPAYGSFSDFPPLMVQVGSTEILFDDSQKIVEKAKSEGINVDFNVWHRMPHFFAIFAGYLPEATKGMVEISAYIQRQLAAPQIFPSDSREMPGQMDCNFMGQAELANM